jgi:hypothetical protein
VLTTSPNSHNRAQITAGVAVRGKTGRVVILPEFTCPRTKNPPVNVNSAGNYFLSDKESAKRMVTQQEISTHG